MLIERPVASDTDHGWIYLRDRILERDGQRCRNCSSENHLDVHHWLPLPGESAGISRSGYRIGAHDHRIVPDSGLITLCRICHSALTGARAVVRLAETTSLHRIVPAPAPEWTSIFRLWKVNGRDLPMKVFRKSWNPEVDHYLLVERIELRNWPFASAWGRYYREGKVAEQRKIKSARSYDWKRLDVGRRPRRPTGRQISDTPSGA